MDFTTSSPELEESNFHDIFFSRPVTAFALPSIGILVGRHFKLYELNTIFEVLQAFNLSPVIIADQTLKETDLPAQLYLKGSNRAISYENADEAIDLIDDCNALFILAGNEANSSFALLTEKVTRNYQGLIITDNLQAVPSARGKAELLVFGSTKQILKKQSAKITAQSGLKLKAELLNGVATENKADIIAIDGPQGLAVKYDNGKKVAVINTVTDINTTALASIIGALLAERSKPYKFDWLSYVLAGGYLYRNYYKQDPKELKQFLNSQF